MFFSREPLRLLRPGPGPGPQPVWLQVMNPRFSEVVGGRKVWELLKACTVGTVKSVFSRFCSNTTTEVKHKIRMFNLATH